MKLYQKLLYSAAIISISTAANADESTNVADYEIIAEKLNESRNELLPETGSSIYSFDQKAIENLPLGSETELNNVLLQAPGVAQDSYGQLHVRGDHADLQYRINGIIIPEGISGFGQTLDTHFADKVDLLTGALPAQYGYRTAGIVDITTKSGSTENGGRTTITGGSNNTLIGNQEFYGSQGRLNYYLNGTYDQDDRGIEPPTPSNIASHDKTRQDKEFGYLSYLLNDENRLSFIFGNATNRFEIPNNPNQPQNFTLAGTPDYPSQNLNENQFERNTYGILALQGVINDKTDYQLALYSRYSDVLFKPDEKGDLIYNGIASRDDHSSFTNGIQNDYSYRLNYAHTIRGGWTFSYERAESSNISDVFTADPVTGAQIGTTPFSLEDNHSKTATLFGIYLQDEWKPLDKLTVNYGARFDQYDAYVSDNQISPRIGAVYDLTPNTKLHTGYAHYFTPPPTELIAPASIDKFAGTTGQLPNDISSAVTPEKDDYFDAGIIQKFGDHFTLGVDAYYKLAHDLLDEGQFGQALIFAPFNYDKGIVKGVELTADYNNGPFTAYSNFALSKAVGKRVVSGQFNFDDPDELAFINSSYVHLDHDQAITGSAGMAYKLGETTLSGDLLYGSGLRAGFANSEHLPFYTQVNLGLAHSFDMGSAGDLDAKFSVINLFDKQYEIRDGSGIGVFAPQYGPRRGFFLTLSKPFSL